MQSVLFLYSFGQRALPCLLKVLSSVKNYRTLSLYQDLIFHFLVMAKFKRTCSVPVGLTKTTLLF